MDTGLLYANFFWETVLKVVLAVVLGCLTGLDRTRKRYPAGFRTYGMVCLGATVAMIVGFYIVEQLGYTASDPARIGAQVVSGVGFIGAGTIVLSDRRRVRGLTTAAGLWSAACLGLAIGAGFYLLAVLCFFGIVAIQMLLQRVSDSIKLRAKILYIHVELTSMEGFGSLIKEIKAANLGINSIETTSGRDTEIYSYYMELRLKEKCVMSHPDVIKMIEDHENVIDCEEIL